MMTKNCWIRLEDPSTTPDKGLEAKMKYKIRWDEKLREEFNDEELREIYGSHAVITRLGKINVIHLDRPGPEVIQKRIEEVRQEKEGPGDIFDVIYDEGD